jgi:aconitate hydratase
MGTVKPALAGPKRPQDRVDLTDMKADVDTALTAPVGPRGFGLSEEDAQNGRRRCQLCRPRVHAQARRVVIAAITSCTNTSTPA